MIHLDSSFLIDLLREQVRERPGPAFDCIESFDPAEVLAVSVHVVCELRAGAESAKRPLAEHEVLDSLLAGLLVSYPDERFGAAYGRLFAATSRGTPMAAMDLLIATAATLDDAALVTRNVKDFAHVPELKLLEY
jgi:predicted nucleic acid-binding protein